MRTVEELLDEAIPEYDYDTISNELHKMLDDKIEKVVLNSMSHGNTKASITLYYNYKFLFESKSVYSDIIYKVFSGYKSDKVSNQAIINDIRDTFTNELKRTYGYKDAKFKRHVYEYVPNSASLELEW